MRESKESAQTRKLKCICSSVAGSRHVWSQCYSVTWPVATPGCARRVVGSRKNKKQNLEFKLQLNADEWAIGHGWKFETHCSYWVQTVSELNFRGLLLLNNLKVEFRGVVKRQKRQNAAVFRLDTTQTKTSFVLVCLRLSNSLGSFLAMSFVRHNKKSRILFPCPHLSISIIHELSRHITFKHDKSGRDYN